MTKLLYLSMSGHKPKTEQASLFEFFRRFPSTKDAVNYMELMKWSGQVTCPKCGGDNVRSLTMKGREYWTCRPCQRHFTVTTGTKLHTNNIDRRKWLLLLWLWSASQRMIGASMSAQSIGVDTDTCLRMLDTIRDAIGYNDEVFSGTVEIDECFLTRHKRRLENDESEALVSEEISPSRQPVIGIYERDTKRIILKQVPNRGSWHLRKLIERHVKPGSTAYTDQHEGYRFMEENYFRESVNHTSREWVRGDVSTNGVENVWSHFKWNLRTIHGRITEAKVQGYCNEFAWRWNNKHMSPWERFEWITTRILSPCDQLQEAKDRADKRKAKQLRDTEARRKKRLADRLQRA